MKIKGVEYMVGGGTCNGSEEKWLESERKRCRGFSKLCFSAVLFSARGGVGWAKRERVYLP